MTIEELNKLIQEELSAYLNEEQTNEVYQEDGDEDGDDIEVTTDEPSEEGEALDTLKQIYDLIKPQVEDEEEAPEMDMEEPEGEEAPEEEEGGEEEEEGGEEEEENLDEAQLNELFDVGVWLAENFGITVEALHKIIALTPYLAGGLFMAIAAGKDKLRAFLEKNPKVVDKAKELGEKDPEFAVKGDVDENLDRPNYKASDVQDATFKAEKIKGGLNESVDTAARFQKLANIKK